MDEARGEIPRRGPTPPFHERVYHIIRHRAIHIAVCLAILFVSMKNINTDLKQYNNNASDRSSEQHVNGLLGRASVVKNMTDEDVRRIADARRGAEEDANVVADIRASLEQMLRGGDNTTDVKSKIPEELKIENDGIPKLDSKTEGTQDKDSNDSKPNILILYADDWRHDTLGVASNNLIHTPNLDKLAREGVRFTQNCVTTSVCDISRVSLLTSMWMSRHGMHHGKYTAKFRVPWKDTFPGALRDNGYHVGHVGKWHIGANYRGRYDFAKAYHGWHLECGKKKNKYDQECLDLNPKQADTIEHITITNEKHAMEFLNNRPKDKPFALTVAFFATHAIDGEDAQYFPQEESMDLYKNVDIPVPQTATNASWERMPVFFEERNEGRRRYHWRFDSPKQHQTMMRNYYRLVTEVDATCGRILKKLKKQGVLNNTLIIFTTDNGNIHGEHGLADKWYPHQESIRVPLIIKDPRMNKRRGVIGTTNDEFTLNVDLAPTILSAAGITPPSSMQGRDISHLYLNSDHEHKEWRKDFFYEHPIIGNSHYIPSSEALVTKKYKYFYWPDFETEQLFDLEADPVEDHDLIQSVKHIGVIRIMRRRFKELKSKAALGRPDENALREIVMEDKAMFNY